MNRVSILSPCAGDTEKQIEIHRNYAIDAMFDSIKRDECPMVSHLLYTLVLDDENIGDRELGMELGMKWFDCIDYAVAYVDHGISKGMKQEIDQLKRMGIKIIHRNFI